MLQLYVAQRMFRVDELFIEDEDLFLCVFVMGNGLH